jgi:hypothetical protein
MSTIEEIEKAVESLAPQELARNLAPPHAQPGYP